MLLPQFSHLVPVFSFAANGWKTARAGCCVAVAAFGLTLNPWAGALQASPPPHSADQDPPGTPLSAELLLRPTIRHPNLTGLLAESGGPMHLKLTRDEDGRPVDALHIHGYAPREESRVLEKAIWASLSEDADLPERLGILDDGRRSEPLAITQLLLLYHLLEAAC